MSDTSRESIPAYLLKVLVLGTILGVLLFGAYVVAGMF